MMNEFRQGSVSKRAAISMIALYALLMQGFLVSAAQTETAGPLGGITCAPGKSGSNAPRGEDHRSHGVCCILACAASAAAFLEASNDATVSPARTASDVVWADRGGAGIRQTQRFHFAARGPPVSV